MPFAPRPPFRLAPRVPRGLFVALAALVALVGLVVVAGLALVVWFGIQAAALVRDAPAVLARAADEVVTRPALVATLDRKLACVEAAGGPSADSLYAQALEYAPTPESRARLEALGKELALPRDASVTKGMLLSRCVSGTPLETPARG